MVVFFGTERDSSVNFVSLLLRIVSFGILYRSSTERERERAYDICSHSYIHSIAIESPFLFAFKDAFFHNFFLQLPFSPSTDSPFCCCHSNFFLSLSIRGQFFFVGSYLKSSQYIPLNVSKKGCARKSYNFRNGQIFMHLKLDFALSTEKVPEIE